MELYESANEFLSRGIEGPGRVVTKWMETFRDFPPLQRPNSFTIDDALWMLSTSGKH